MLVFASIGVFLIWAGLVSRISFVRAAGSLGIAALIVAPFLVSRLLFSASGSSSYLIWQFFREPNHSGWYFPGVLITFCGAAFVLLAVYGVVLIALRRSYSDRLILCWIVVLFGFMQIWPTKLFPYLMAVVPAFSIVAGVATLDIAARVKRNWPARFGRGLNQTVLASALALAVLASMGLRTFTVLTSGVESVGNHFDVFDIEVHDFEGAREFALWARDSTPSEARFLTVGPSLGNVLAFYGNRPSNAISVSPDPARRNPAYVPVVNPDLAIRQGSFQYAVWDSLSANRSPFNGGRLRGYAEKYGTAVVFSVYRDEQGNLAQGREVPDRADPLIVVFDLVGGEPLPIVEAED